MAVQKSRKSRSRTGKKRSHMALKLPTLSIDPETGEVHRRHHITPNGFYRGKQIIQPKEQAEAADSTEG
jgi:large subunit ribosomal protein L32